MPKVISSGAPTLLSSVMGTCFVEWSIPDATKGLLAATMNWAKRFKFGSGLCEIRGLVIH